MQHFVDNDGYNTFRLPVSWQFLTNDVLTATLDETNFAKYDDLVQACLATGANCIIDIHNYARWNGEVRPSVVTCLSNTDLRNRLSAKVDLATTYSQAFGQTLRRNTRQTRRLYSECKPIWV